MEKKDFVKVIIKISVLVIFLAILVFVSIKYIPDIIKLISNTNKFKDYIQSFGNFGILIYILFQIMHIIIVFIPGEFVQIAGGYIFGTFYGSIYTFIGMFIGVVIVFMTTKILGYSVIKIFVPAKDMEKFNFLINSPKSEIVMFVLFLIPGIPKDTLTYIAGLTPIKPLRFFLLSSVARLPGIIGSCYIGAKLESHSYIPVIIVSVIAIIVFVIGLIFQEKIVTFLHNLKTKKEN